MLFNPKSKITAAILAFVANNSFAHEEGAAFSGAIIDLLRVHHAHIEDEQKVNFSFIDDIDNIDGNNAYHHSLEIAVSWDSDLQWGSELLIPYSNTGGNGADIGDISVQMVKYAFINQPETVLTGAFGMTLPTGSKSKGLGGENTAVEVALFFDNAYKNWYWGLNLELGTTVSGESETEFELATALSYSFIDGTTDFASSKPRQKFVPSISLEFVSENILSGAEEGTRIATVVPGLHLWSPGAGWSIRFGVELPISSDRENSSVYLLQIGTHKGWKGIFH